MQVPDVSAVIPCSMFVIEEFRNPLIADGYDKAADMGRVPASKALPEVPSTARSFTHRRWPGSTTFSVH